MSAIAGTWAAARSDSTRARATGRLVGLSGNYVEVQFDGADGLMGRLTRVRVTGVERDRTLGEVA